MLWPYYKVKIFITLPKYPENYIGFHYFRKIHIAKFGYVHSKHWFDPTLLKWLNLMSLMKIQLWRNSFLSRFINLYFKNKLLKYRIRSCLVSLWIWKNLCLWKFCLTKILCQKLLLRTYNELYLFILCFSYLAVIIKGSSSYSFEKKL